MMMSVMAISSPSSESSDGQNYRSNCMPFACEEKEALMASVFINRYPAVADAVLVFLKANFSLHH